MGNYEKSLENSAAAGLSTNGRADPRSVANLIVNSAYTSVRDCTGSTDSTGAHGPGIGMPPCPFSTVFAQVCEPSRAGYRVRAAAAGGVAARLCPSVPSLGPGARRSFRALLTAIIH